MILTPEEDPVSIKLLPAASDDVLTTNTAETNAKKHKHTHTHTYNA